MRRAIIGVLNHGYYSRERARRHRLAVIVAARLTSLLLAGVAAITLLAPQAAFCQGRFEIVSFQSATFPGSLFSPPFMAAPEQGVPATIFGILRLPEAAGRVPAVVITHGCSGITGAETYWAEKLVELGVATFIVNSFVGRSIPRACSGPHTISSASVLTDVYRARGILADHPRIDPARMVLMGFSFGGRNALWAGYPRFQQRYGAGLSPFAAHLAFYPTSCHIQLADDTGVGEVPTRIFHGAADDITTIARCREYVIRLRNAGRDVALFEYAGARHWFDNADLANRQTPTGPLNFSNCTFREQGDTIIDAATGGLAGTGSPCVVSEGSFGYHAASRDQATADVREFLRRLFKL